MVDDGVDRSMDEMASLTMKQPGDSTDTTVRPQSCVLVLPSPSALAGDKEEEEPVLGGGYQADDGEEDEVSYDSDDSYDEEESDDEVEWAGSSLAPLIYPARHNSKLQEIWSELVTNVAVGIPPGTTRLKVMADVGILRLEDYTYWRMHAVMNALLGIKAEPWPGYHVHELRLPEPVHVQCADEDEAADGDCERPAKRRKIVTEEGAAQKCPICLDPLESDAAAWPGCSSPHVFHGACLEGTLKESQKCPICRRRLSAQDEEVRAEA
uniref:RING-type domain-containing protein n=1 Tax=Aegilops tauschii TaxID=37682 RepID=M8BGX2_AEGTA